MHRQSQSAQQSPCLHTLEVDVSDINMRVLVAVSCLLAVASAGYYGGAPAPVGQYRGPLHIPVLDHNGVPVEPKEVQEARRNHLAALAAVPTGPADNQGYAAPGQHYQQQYAAPGQQYQQQYAAPQQRYQQAQYSAPQQHYQQQPQYVPVIDRHGVPQDAPEVAAAKAAHFAAYAQVSARAAPIGSGTPGGYSAPQHQYQPQYAAPQHHQPQYVPQIDAHGMPQDAPDVAAAKAAHFAAYAQVSARAAPAPGHYQPTQHWSA